MKKVYIEITNSGEIDPLSLSLLGASTKRDDSTKIGFFGSGNKYAIALLLRKNIPFKIFSGEKEIKIEKEQIMFRGQLYEQIIVDGNKTSLTTDMGPTWEDWFAIRELYCNAIDEGGYSLKVSNKPKGKKGETRVFVFLNETLNEFFKDINEYILADYKPLDTQNTRYGKVELLSSSGEQFICYRKGIRIFPENTIKSLYWYNFDDIEINESRTYMYEHQVRERIASVLAMCHNEHIIKHYLSHWKGNYEENAQWEYCNNNLSDTWYEILKGQRVYPENLAIHSGDYEAKHNSFIVPNTLALKIHEQYPDICVVGYGNSKYDVLEMTEFERNLINRAKSELAEIGYEITSEIKIAKNITNDTIAWYDRKTNTIYHTREQLKDLAELKNTLLEEHFHSLGHMDGQREFVTFLIDELIKSKER